MPGGMSLLNLGLWIFMAILSLGLGYVAIVYRLQPVFLLPLAAGLLFANLPVPDLSWARLSFFHVLQGGLASGVYPALIFLGWGAGANLHHLIAHPRQLVLGFLTPISLFTILLLGRSWGLNPLQAGSIAMIGGGDGLSATFLVAHLAPDLLGPVSLAAFTLVGLNFWLQPYLVLFLTTKKERLLRLPPTRKVSKRENLLFAVAGLLLTLILVPRAALLTGMFFLGNLLKESGVVDRLARTLANRLAEIVAVLLGLAVGSRCRAEDLLSVTFVKVMVLGLAALILATVVVMIAIKIVNLFSSQKINPLIGAAALGLVPDAAQVVQIIGRKEDPHNNLYTHALASSQAALLASTLTAGLLWSILSGG